MKKYLRINKIVVYLIVGLLIMVLHNFILDHDILYLIVGITTLTLALEGLVYDFVTKKYKTENNHIGSELFKLAIALVILVRFNKSSDFEMVCICWSIIVVVSNVKVLNKSIGHMFKHESFLFHMAFSIAQLVLAMLLISNPRHHASMHVIILGLEYVLEAIEIGINLFYVSKNKKKYLLDMQ